MHENDIKKEKVVLVGVHQGLKNSLMDTTDESMNELHELVETAGGEVVGTMVQNRSFIETATYIGEGKLEELANACKTLEANLVVFDDELSGSQVREIEKVLGDGVSVLDRNMIILDIFAQRATSNEGKIQVELAQMRYMLPRLTGLGKQLSRLGGGIGTRGPGETKLETDRRHIRKRISNLEDNIKEISKNRLLIRNRRKKDGVLSAAIVGYTNAGKSTLLNKLTDAGVSSRNRLFETLDPTARALTLSDNRSVLLVDTVGFIRRLPHQFIEAFKSTLEEAVVADVLIHVVDASNPEFPNQIEVVEKLLDELNCLDKPIITAYNKSDIAGEFVHTKSENSIDISAQSGDGIDKLLAILEDVLPGKKVKIKLLIPFANGNLVSEIHKNHSVLSEDYTESGTLLECLVSPEILGSLKEFEVN